MTGGKGRSEGEVGPGDSPGYPLQMDMPKPEKDGLEAPLAAELSRMPQEAP